MSKRIILADDSITTQKIVSITFKDEDYDLIIADDGETAISRIKEVRPDLVMADVAVPDKNGYAICKEIKSDPELKDTPVILLAGTFEPIDEEEAKRVGADDQIVKPFEPEELLEKVRTIFGRTSAGQTEAEKPFSEESLTEPDMEIEIPSEVVGDDIFSEGHEEEAETPSGAPEQSKEAEGGFVDFGEEDEELEQIEVIEELSPEPAISEKQEPSILTEEKEEGTSLPPSISREKMEEVVEKVAREVIRDVAREIFPKIAEECIREEIRKAKEAIFKKD